MYPAGHFLGAQRNGLNLTSMNLGAFDHEGGPIEGTNYPVYSDALFDWYQAKLVESVRLLFTWEAVQPALDDAANDNYARYWADLVDAVNRLLARGIYVILGPWQYNPESDDTDIVYDGAPFTPAQFADFWRKFAAAINGATGNDQRVAFDLINEPHEQTDKHGDIGIELGDWFTGAQAAIDAIRGAGGANTIFVPGMAYTAASSFTTNGSAAEWLKLIDPLQNIAVSVHCYNFANSRRSTVLRDLCGDVVAWGRNNAVKVNIGEIAIDAGPNGMPAYRSDFATAQAQWADWSNFCVENKDVLTGWNWWACSAGGWWDQGDSLEGSHWGLTVDDGASQTVYMDLIESSLSRAGLDSVERL